jgi:hypothetical protein
MIFNMPQGWLILDPNASSDSKLTYLSDNDSLVRQDLSRLLEPWITYSRFVLTLN